MANHYESIFILKADLPEEDIEKVIAKMSGVVTSGGGTVEKIEKWGKKRFAFELMGMKEGYYVFFSILAPPALVAELDRTYRVTEDILRSLTTRVEVLKKVPAKLKKKKKKKEAVQPVAAVTP